MSFVTVITDHDFPDLVPEERILLPLGIELRVAESRDRAGLRAALAQADAVVNQFVLLDAEMIAAMARCLAIVRYGVGYDTVDVATATQAGICVVNVPDYGTREVALHAVSLMLAVQRRLLQYDASLRRGQWMKGPHIVPPIRRLHGQTLGIVGLGRIGRAVAALAAPLGLTIFTYDPYVTRRAASDAGAMLMDYRTLLGQADVVTFHTPLTKETDHLLGDAEIRLMKPGAIVINTSRGPVVDTVALARALEEGRLAGAALDVFEREPLSADHPLRTAPNTILTPHVAWYSEESMYDLRRGVAEEVARVARGEWPRSLVNSEVRAVARLGRG